MYDMYKNINSNTSLNYLQLDPKLDTARNAFWSETRSNQRLSVCDMLKNRYFR